LIGKQEPSVAGIVYPQKSGDSFPIFWGDKEILLPIFENLEDAYECCESIDTVINYQSFRSAFTGCFDAINHPKIKTVVIVAEGIAERDARSLIKLGKEHKKTIIGPSTVGCLFPKVLRLGNTCGSIDNIKKLKLDTTGEVGIVTRSGGLLNEMCNLVSQFTNVSKAISIGGDRYPGSTFLDHIISFERDPNIKIICLLGEVGGILELEIAEAVKCKLITKPIIAWCMGTSAESFDEDIQFGHAGSSAKNKYESATFKNAYMRNANILVPNTFEDIEDLIRKVTNEHKLTHSINHNESKFNPIDFENSNVRRKSEFFSSISNETKDTLEYNSVPVTQIVSKTFSLGRTIGHLLFKKELPDYLAEFLEKVLTLIADHGVAVSSAHNTAVCARSGQNISSSVASGLLCIHDKHGGAIQAAAEEFYRGLYIDKLEPKGFVLDMKKKNQYIPGIGHKYKNSTTRIDKRLVILLKFIKDNFPNFDTVKYAKAVENETLKKKENLILNVDGMVAAAIVSAFVKHFGHKETKDLLSLNCLNSIFIIGRTIGLCATYTDQKRLKQGLYRHPLSGISYIN